MSDYKYKHGDKVWCMQGGELVKRVVTHVCTNGDYIFAQSLHALRHTGARPDELWPRGKKTIARLMAEATPDEPQWSVDFKLADRGDGSISIGDEVEIIGPAFHGSTSEVGGVRRVNHICSKGNCYLDRGLVYRPSSLRRIEPEPKSVDSLLAEIEQLKRERDSALNRIAKIRGFCGG